jgi:hypothetical protein
MLTSAQLSLQIRGEGHGRTPVPFGSSPDTFDCVRRDDQGKSIGLGTCAEGCKRIVDGREVPVMLPVRPCSLHGSCVVAKTTVEGHKCCRDCRDRISPTVAAQAERNRWHWNAADEFVNRWMQPYPADHYSGRGVVIAAGGKYWASAYVAVRMLRHVGCELPVQIWFLGASGERDERYEKLLAPHGATCHDIDTHPARAARRDVKGFQTKLFAVVNSSFEEVLSLDPDCYPCTDPTVLFEQDGYKRLGGIYWPDALQTNAWTKWEFWGVKERGPCGLETGMYVLHKRLAWEPMQLAEWYDDHADWCYGDHASGGGGRGGDYGDKGPHRVAWAKLERDYVVFRHVPDYHPRLGFVQSGPNGPMFVHRCHSKFAAEGALQFPTTPQHGLNLRGGLPGEDAAFGLLEELKAALAKEAA